MVRPMRIDDMIAVVSIPRQAPATSFVLHAPLELMARTILMPHVAVDGRDEAGARLVEMCAAYEASGDPVPPPRPVDGIAADLAPLLVAAIGSGELDDVDRYAAALGARSTPSEIRRLLAPAVVRSLGAAGHASILLYLLPRLPAGELLRGPARELARNPAWQIGWIEETGSTGRRASLGDALQQVPMLGLPGSDFIYPVVAQAEGSGIAAKVLGDVVNMDVASAGVELSRAAAWSMLHEGPEHAPYGWTHCLTIPQAVIGMPVAPRVAVGVAATYVVAFRAALAERALVPGYRPDRPDHDLSLDEAIATSPERAAAAAWHGDPTTVRTTLATRASAHADAHYVKYTLACFDAARADPVESQLYLAAAASLAGWWATRDA